MGFKEYWKKKDKELEKAFDKINIRKLYPGYVSLWVFRSAWIFILCLVLLDIYLSGGLVSYKVSCPIDSEHCENPFYMCQDGEFSILDNCEYSIPDKICKDVPCDKRYIAPGQSYGRDDWLSKWGVTTLFGVLLLAFVVNHLLYWKKTGNWIYKKK